MIDTEKHYRGTYLLQNCWSEQSETFSLTTSRLLRMQTSSGIPRFSSNENSSISPKTGDIKEKQETPKKLSLTDQGKSAKLLRKRLAFALATNAKIKSDSSNSASEASDQETAAKELRSLEERKSSIPRKIPKENSKKTLQAMQLLGALNDRMKTSKPSQRNRKLGVVSMSNDVGNIQHKDSSNVELQKQKEIVQNSSFVVNTNNVVSGKDMTEGLSREPTNRDESLATGHEQVTSNPKDALGSPKRMKHYNLEDVESELLKLKKNVDKTLEEFLEINVATERVKTKLEELRRERVSCGTVEVF